MIKFFSDDGSEETPQVPNAQENEKIVNLEPRRAASESEYDLLVAEYTETMSSLEKVPHYFKKLAESREDMREVRDELVIRNEALSNECQLHKETMLQFENEAIRLRERVGSLKEKLDQEMRNVRVLQDYRINADADIRDLKGRLYEAERRVERIDPLAKKLAREKDVLQSNLDQLIAEKMGLEKSNSDLDGKLQVAREDISRLETKTDFLDRTKVDLENSLQDAREALSEQEAALRSSDNRLELADKKIEQLRLEIDALRKENEHIVRAREESNRALNNELESARTRARTMEGILEEARTRSRIDSERTADVRKENVQLSLDVSQKDVTIKSLNEQLSEAGARAELSKELQSELDQHNQNLSDKNKQLQGDMDRLNDENSDLLAQKEAAEKTIDNIQKDFDATTAMFEKRLKSLESENADLRRESKRLKELELKEAQQNKDAASSTKTEKDDEKVVQLKT